MRVSCFRSQGYRILRAVRSCALAGCLAALVACSQAGKVTVSEEACPRKERPASVAEDLAFHEQYAEVLTLIEKGRLREARGKLDPVLKGPEMSDGTTTAVFELATVLLMQKQDLTRLKAFKEAFQRYSQSLPEGTARENSARIVGLLDRRIADAYRERKQLKELNRRVEEQGKALETLEYKLKKLEEIQKESEHKREDFQHK